MHIWSSRNKLQLILSQEFKLILSQKFKLLQIINVALCKFGNTTIFPRLHPTLLNQFPKIATNKLTYTIVENQKTWPKHRTKYQCFQMQITENDSLFKFNYTPHHYRPIWQHFVLIESIAKQHCKRFTATKEHH